MALQRSETISIGHDPVDVYDEVRALDVDGTIYGLRNLTGGTLYYDETQDGSNPRNWTPILNTEYFYFWKTGGTPKIWLRADSSAPNKDVVIFAA